MTSTKPLPKIYNSLVRPPSFLIECGYYATLFYSMLGVALGVSIPLFGAGLLAVLTGLCVLHFGQISAVVFRPIILALTCAVSILFLQTVVHEESIRHDEVRSFVTWILSLLVVQSLCYRKGFLHRFANVSFMIGLCTLPFLKVYVDIEEYTRIGTSGTGLANPNAFSMWFGFCAVYFMIVGLQAQNYIVRIGSWSAGLLCLYLVGITVSRGNLLGVSIACAFAFRKMLKRSFLPIIMLLIAGWLIYVTGIVDNLIDYYVERGAEETGRSYLWEVSLNKFLDAWWAGVGLSNSLITLPESGYETNSHNGLLFIAVSSGILPLILFVGYLVGTARAAYQAECEQRPDALFLFPLFIFALLTLMLSATVFMSPWHLVTFAAATSLRKSGLDPSRSSEKPIISSIS